MAVAFVRDHVAESVKVAGTTDVYATTALVAAGNLLVAVSVHDNAAAANSPTITSISKPASETASWVFLGRATYPNAATAGGFANGEMWAIKTTVDWPNATSLTFTYSTSITMKAQNLIEFSGAETTQRSTIGITYTTGTSASVASVGGTSPAIGDLALGFLFGSNVAAAQSGDTDTTGGSWSTPIGVGSTGGSAATNNFGIVQYKVLTTASYQAYSSPVALTAGNGAICAILQPTPDPVVSQAAYRFYADGTEAAPATLADSYAESNRDGARDMSPATFPSLGQSFLGDGKRLARAGFYLWRNSGSFGDGIVTAHLYAHTGTFGSTSIPTGAALATSNSIATNTVGPVQAVFGWYEFDFPSAYQLGNGTPYVIVLTTTNTVSSALGFGTDTIAPTHGGNLSGFNGTTWSASAGVDAIFRVYTSVDAGGLAAQDTGATADLATGDVNLALRVRLQETNVGPVPATDDWQVQWEKNASGTWTNPGAGTVVPYDSPNLTDGAATTSRLTGGTGTFTPGKVSEDGLVDNLGWAKANHTEVLYSLTLKAADLADADVLRFRVLRNGAAITYAQTPTVTASKATGPPAYTANPALSGAGTLGAGGAPDISATPALSGSGGLSASVTPKPTGTASLTGGGGLSATGVVSYVAATALSGDGSLTLGLAPQVAGSPALTGSGTLGAVGVVPPPVGTYRTGTYRQSRTYRGVAAAGPAYTASPTLSGGGTLTASTTPRWTTLAALSGGGTLSATVTPRPATATTLSGTGTLVAAVTPRPVAAAALSGSGTLAAVTVMAAGSAATLSGSGSLAAAATPKPTAAVALGGTGTLVAAGATSGGSTVALSGSGTLSATAVPSLGTALTLSGTGTLAATLTPKTLVAPALSGTGTMAVTVVPRPVATAALSGGGTLAAAGATSGGATAALSGGGTLSATATTKVVTTAALSGSGSLAASATARPVTAATLGGGGTLSASTAFQPTATPVLGGDGTLTASTTPRTGVAAVLGGSGALSAVAATSGGATASLSGSGTLNATVTPKAVGVLALTGSGGLSATVLPRPATAPSLTGSGTLTATVRPKPAAVLALTGSGALSTFGFLRVGGSAALTGTGTMTAIGFAGAAGEPADNPGVFVPDTGHHVLVTPDGHRVVVTPRAHRVIVPQPYAGSVRVHPSGGTVHVEDT